MKKIEYRCSARPRDNGGKVCGAAAKDHGIKKVVVSPTTGLALAPHAFAAEAIRES